jgi:hypothetical protein
VLQAPQTLCFGQAVVEPVTPGDLVDRSAAAHAQGHVAATIGDDGQTNVVRRIASVVRRMSEDLFGLYAVGLALGFFGYLIVNYRQCGINIGNRLFCRALTRCGECRVASGGQTCMSVNVNSALSNYRLNPDETKGCLGGE